MLHYFQAVLKACTHSVRPHTAQRSLVFIDFHMVFIAGFHWFSYRLLFVSDFSRLDQIRSESIVLTDTMMMIQEEPRVLPARVPNLLINGSSGIAVGIATRIPPHNLREVVSGLHALIDKPDITVPELMKHIPAPDFPTGTLPFTFQLCCALPKLSEVPQ